MKAIALLLSAVFAVIALNSYFKAEQDEATKRGAGFHLGSPAGEVRKNLGEPLRVVATQPGAETWFYSTVAIDFGHGSVIDSRKIPRR